MRHLLAGSLRVSNTTGWHSDAWRPVDADRGWAEQSIAAVISDLQPVGFTQFTQPLRIFGIFGFFRSAGLTATLGKQFSGG